MRWSGLLGSFTGLAYPKEVEKVVEVKKGKGLRGRLAKGLPERFHNPSASTSKGKEGESRGSETLKKEGILATPSAPVPPAAKGK